ncbi:aldo/keto reductase [Candidatus Latescibacterota bacterium]
METSGRRNFIKNGAAAGLGLAASCSDSNRIDETAKIDDSIKKTGLDSTIRYRTLGSTGYQVSEIGFGAMNTRNAELIHAAIDAGINYVDTAHGYMRGVNEEIVGSVMQTKRDKVFLTTKIGVWQSTDISGMLSLSLKRLQTDHVDLVLMHAADERDQVNSQELMQKFDEVRQKGMTRFIGLSNHSNQSGVLDAVTEGKFWDAVLVGYNYFSSKDVSASIKQAREAGVAIIGMKNLLNPHSDPWVPLADIREDKSSSLTPQQALIKWVLEDPNVDTTIPGMESFEHLAEDLAIMNMELAYDEKRTLRQFSENIKDYYCCGLAGCIGCRNKCPNGVQVNEINRCLGYVYGYSNLELARENYERLDPSTKLENCSDCTECKVKCVNGLNLTENINRARSIFS